MNQNESQVTKLTASAMGQLDPSALASRLKTLRLPMMRTCAMNLAVQAAKENWSHLDYLSAKSQLNWPLIPR